MLAIVPVESSLPSLPLASFGSPALALTGDPSPIFIHSILDLGRTPVSRPLSASDSILTIPSADLQLACLRAVRTSALVLIPPGRYIFRGVRPREF